MATEYERIDALFKAVAGLLTPHLDTCESSITEYDDGDISDMVTNIEDNQMNIEDISDRMDSVEDGVITTDTIDDHVLTGDALIDEIDDRIRYQLNDSINEKINDYFQYEGGGDLIVDVMNDHITGVFEDRIREELQAQLSPERLVSMFIEGLAEALNANKDGRYTVTIRDEVA